MPGSEIDDRWRILLRVADAGSLSKAAAVLAMPHTTTGASWWPTVSPPA